MNNKALKMVLALFFINSISLYFYFSSQPEYPRPLPEHRRPLLDTNAASESTQSHHPLPVKLWPVLPSYLPWSPNSNVRFRSCEAYFGNGFTHRVDVLKPAAEPHRKIQPGGGGGGGWFRCFHSETLSSSVCEGGRVRMIPEKIAMSHGGERLESVIGRRESDELPEFEDGAFEIEVADESRGGMRMVEEEFLDNYVERGPIDRHAMRELMSSIRLVDAREFVCSKWIEEPTVFVTRFEYANLFHTVTDWYSAYVASRVTGLPNRPHLVFVDGHCQTPLEETWRKLFSSLTYAKNFTGPVCFRRAILAPLGYENVLFKGLDGTADCCGTSAHDLWQNPDDRKTARLSEFGEMIRAAFGFPVDRDRIPEPSSSSGLNILFVRRENYLAHPRHRGRVQERLSNEQEVFDAVNRWARDHTGCRLNIVNGTFAHMSMKEQVRAIQDASVIVGAHGAGLTHIVSATRNAVILEILSNEFRRPHFRMIAQWKGLAYHTVDLPRSYAEPRQVVEKLRYILRGIGC